MIKTIDGWVIIQSDDLDLTDDAKIGSGTVLQQAIISINVYQDLCRHIVSLSHTELYEQHNEANLH